MPHNYLTDTNWLYRISHRLDQFSVTGTGNRTFVCRCPYCGDSKKSKKKARFYFYTIKSSLNFDCKNCGASGSFYRFMREQMKDLFDEYKRERVMEGLRSRSAPFKSSTPSLPLREQPETLLERSTLSGCVPLTSLPSDHKAITYLESRGFTEREMKRLMFSEDFSVTAASISPEPLSEEFPKDSRIVIPFYSEDGSTVEMIQGRVLGSEPGIRYLTIKSSDDIDKIYGKNDIDRTKTSYCVEGALDSLFVENCVATCDSNLIRSDADVLIFDCEPRSKEIVKLMEDAIQKGRKVVVWPISPNKKIDINDMVIGGMARPDIMNIIKQNTYEGIMAKLQLTKWKKV